MRSSRGYVLNELMLVSMILQDFVISSTFRKRKCDDLIKLMNSKMFEVYTSQDKGHDAWKDARKDTDNVESEYDVDVISECNEEYEYEYVSSGDSN